MEKSKKNEIEILSKITLFDKFHKADEVTLKIPSFSGNHMTEPFNREVFYFKKAACIVLYQPETDRILLSKQFRFGAFFCDAENPWLVELAAGIIDPGEEPKDAAIREAFEETGTKVVEFEEIGNIYTSPGSVAEEFFLFCGRVPEGVEDGIFGEIHEGEEVKTSLVPASEAIKMLDNGEIKNGISYCALSWFARHHDRLKEKWSE